MRKNLPAIIAAVVSFSIGAVTVAVAARTNYLGTVFIADSTVPSRQMTVNANGSINVACH